jgi:hypothetical protein
MLLLIAFVLLPPFMCTPITTSKNNITHQTSEQSSSPSLGDAVVNVQHFTQFIYEGNQVYVYSAKLNDEYGHQPLKWSFYYVPVLQPFKSSNTTEWVWANKKEVRMKLTLGNDQVEDAARRAIARRFDTDVASNYSRFWIVAPLMIDSMTAFIVKVSGDPAEGVAPFRLVHPNALAITFRYECSNGNTTHDIVEKLIDGDYEVEVNFYFAGFKHVSSNIVSITGEHLKSVLSKTTADGGNSNAKYIHRSQANKFIGIYATNVKKLIYTEKPGIDLSVLTSGLDEQFQALFQQGETVFSEYHCTTFLIYSFKAEISRLIFCFGCIAHRWNR